MEGASGEKPGGCDVTRTPAGGNGTGENSRAGADGSGRAARSGGHGSVGPGEGRTDQIGGSRGARAARPAVALVTGAGGGIGLETAVLLASSGFRVAAGLRDPSRADALLARAREAGAADRILPLRMDVTDAGQIRAAVEEAESRFGGIGVLVNNAGFAAGGYTETIPPETWRRQFDVNLFGAVETVRAVLPGMRRRGSGLIVQVGSVSGRIGMPGFAAYNASKFALAGWSEALRHELRPLGIDVVLVEFGSYRTGIWNKGLTDLPEDIPGGYLPQYRRMLDLARRSAERAPDARLAAERIVRIVRKRGRVRRFQYPGGAGIRLAFAARALLPWPLWERALGAVMDGKPPKRE
jgi:NAD(P)-dependent dehydrogenase (short-subunit alcohol dehydrogenase family)